MGTVNTNIPSLEKLFNSIELNIDHRSVQFQHFHPILPKYISIHRQNGYTAYSLVMNAVDFVFFFYSGLSGASTAFKGLQLFPQNLGKQQRRQMRGNGE